MTTVKLNDQVSIPILAYGTGTAWYKTSNDTGLNRSLVEATKTAIRLGYRHLDGAEVYNTEAELGAAIKESGVPREQLFVTTKVIKNIADIPGAIDASLKKLQLEYVDLYLIHSPFFAKTPEELQAAWKAMEAVQRSGKARAIGVSNYTRSHLETTFQTATIPPAINQIEYHPYLHRPVTKDTLSFHREKDVKTASYSPLTPLTRAAGGPVDEKLKELAGKYGVSEGDVLLRWAVEKGDVVITTSGREERLKEYRKVLEFGLQEEEVREIERLGEGKFHRVFWQKEFGDA